jgi:hypothetical protein
MVEQDITAGLAPVTAIDPHFTVRKPFIEGIDTWVVGIGILDPSISVGVTGISVIDTFGAAIGNTLVVDTGEEALGTFGVVVTEEVIVIDD